MAFIGSCVGEPLKRNVVLLLDSTTERFLNGTMAKILREVLPGLAQELEALLRADNESELAAQISSLEVVDRCRCQSDSCATLYNVPKPKGAWGPSHRNVVLDTVEGMTVVDVLDERIVCIEILDRDEITAEVVKLFP